MLCLCHRIKLLECLGEGAFGVVMKASMDTPDGTKTVAVKMLREDHNDEDVKILVSEMEVMKRIGRHPNIINLLGCCTQGGPVYVVVEYATNKSLKEFFKDYNKQRLRQASGYQNLVSDPKNSDDLVLQKELSYADLLNFAYKVCVCVFILIARIFCLLTILVDRLR